MIRFAVVALLGLAPVVAAPVPKDFKKRPDYYPLAVGTKREYAAPATPDRVTQVREITAVGLRDGKTVFTMVRDGDHDDPTVLRPTPDGVFMVEQDGVTFDPPHPVVRADMKPGDRWPCGDGSVRTVGQPKEITVPAGTFTAYPITVTRPKDRIETPVTVWYADGVGLVRYDTGERTTLVLTRYTPGKEAKK